MMLNLVERKAHPRRAGKSDTDGEELRIGIAADTGEEKIEFTKRKTFSGNAPEFQPLSLILRLQERSESPWMDSSLDRQQIVSIAAVHLIFKSPDFENSLSRTLSLRRRYIFTISHCCLSTWRSWEGDLCKCNQSEFARQLLKSRTFMIPRFPPNPERLLMTPTSVRALRWRQR